MAAPASVLADDGESLGSIFDLQDDVSFSGGGDMGGGENEGVEEDAGVEGQSWRILPVCLIVITSNKRK